MIEMPEAFHTGSDEVPSADDWAGTPGIRLKLLMADIEGARFAVGICFAPGILLPPHKPKMLPIGGAMRYRAVPQEPMSVVH